MSTPPRENSPVTPPRKKERGAASATPTPAPGLGSKEYPNLSATVPTRHEDKSIAQRKLAAARKNMTYLFGHEFELVLIISKKVSCDAKRVNSSFTTVYCVNVEEKNGKHGGSSDENLNSKGRAKSDTGVTAERWRHEGPTDNASRPSLTSE